MGLFPAPPCPIKYTDMLKFHKVKTKQHVFRNPENTKLPIAIVISPFGLAPLPLDGPPAAP